MASTNTTNDQCPVCKDDYDLKEHRPKILPCDHTICKQCIKSLGQDFECPVCRYCIKSSDFVGMTTNFIALKIAETNKDCDDQVSCEAFESDDSGEKTPTSSEDFLNEYSSLNKNELKGNICSIAENISSDDLELDLDCKFCNAFDLTSQKMSTFEAQIDCLKCSKEDTLKDVEAEFEHLVQLVIRRKQLLKNQVLTQYEEKLEALEERMEKVTFTTMCLTSLQKHSELVFNEYNTAKKNKEAEVDETDVTDVSKLQSNIQKIDSEIEELMEQLHENQKGMTKEGFVYQSYGTENVEKGIRTLGRVKLQTICAGAEFEEDSTFD